MTAIRYWPAVLLVALAVGFATSCRSISDSVTSPSRWLADSSGALADSSNASSRSSSPGKESAPEQAFRDDVRVATRSWAASSGDASDWLRQLGRIAQRHGVVHWEGQPGAWIAIGSGLGEAGLSEPEMDAVLARLAGIGGEQRTLVREGYAAAL